MRAVNLLPRDEQRVALEGMRAPLLVVAGGVAAVTTAAVVLGLSAGGTAEDRRAELAAVEAAIATLPRPPRSVVSQGVLAQERTDRTAALAAALSSRIAFDRLFRQISVVLPDDAWLTGIKAISPIATQPAEDGGRSPVPAPTPTGLQGVTIQGATYTHSSVALVLSRLSVLPALEDVSLTSSALVEPEAAVSTPGQPQAAPAPKTRKPVVTFVITASVRTGASS